MHKNRVLHTRLLAAVAMAAFAAGCVTKSDPETTGSIAQPGAALEQSAKKDPAAIAEYGRKLAQEGRNEAALEALSAASRHGKPDWRVFSAKGAVLDQLDRGSEAREAYLAALKLAPSEPSVLSNLGLSYALDGKIVEAEKALASAAADKAATAKIRQNYALVLALKGDFARAEEVAGRDMPPDQAKASVKYWREAMAKPKKEAEPVAGMALRKGA